MVPRREGKREEKSEEAGHRRRKAAVVPRWEMKSEKLQMQQKTGCQMARVLPGNTETVVLWLLS